MFGGGIAEGLIAAWVWEKKYKLSGIKVPQSFKWNEAAEAYQKKVNALYGTLRVLGKAEPVSLEGIFTDVYILDKPSAFYRFDIQQLKEDKSLFREAKRKNGLEVVKHIKNNRLFILGKPGAGKTTFLKYIALQTVQGNLHKIPIFVSLKEWSDSGLELMSFLVEQFAICNFPDAQAFIEHILNVGDAIVLFDGLDEVQQEDEQRAQLITIINNFSKKYLTCQCLITCRIAATDYSFEHFTYMEVADFTDEQMQTFAKKWFKDNPTKLDLFLKELAKDEHKGLRDLGRIPLLLTLLCLAFEETMHFPARQVEIYEEALEALLKKWDVSRNIRRDDIYRKLSLGRKRQLFARVAAETFEKGDYFLRQADLAQQIVAYLQLLPPPDRDEDIDGDAVLKAIEAQHSIFVERAHQIYSFSHLTFQEYFTAKYIADNANHGTLDGLINNYLDDRWHEVFLLVISLLDNADAFFDLFKRAINDLIAGSKTLVKLLNWINSKVITVNVPFKPSVIRSIYCNFALITNSDHIHARAIDNDIFNKRSCSNIRGFNRDIVFDFNLEYDIDHGIKLTYDLDNKFNFAIAKDINLDFNLTFALLSASIVSRVSEDNFISIQNKTFKLVSYFNHAVNLSMQNGLSDLHHALINFAIPTENDSQQVWKTFVANLREIMQIHCKIGYEWNLTKKQIKLLEQYLIANQLLVKCLDLAVVSDREGIKNSLLLPPSTN
jgi:hypothetical protein